MGSLNLSPHKRRSLRRHCAARDGELCFYCGSQRRLSLDHVVPRAQGGRSVYWNIVLACNCCNQRKGSMPFAEFVAWVKAHPKWLASNAHARPALAPALRATAATPPPSPSDRLEPPESGQSGSKE